MVPLVAEACVDILILNINVYKFFRIKLRRSRVLSNLSLGGVGGAGTTQGRPNNSFYMGCAPELYPEVSHNATYSGEGKIFNI